MERPKISIIVPVYNTELFLDKCLESLYEQTFKDYEVLMINDGSTDGSLKIMEKYQNKSEKFQIIQNLNKGISFSRNLGLSEAKGDYIAFVDSDDFVSPDFLKILYNKAVESNADIVVCNYIIYNYENNTEIKYPFKLKEGLYKKPKALKHLIYDCRINYYVWNKLWKRSVLVENNINFLDMCFEDTDFSIKAFYNAREVFIVSNELYYYVKHEKSMTAFVDTNKIKDYLYALAGIRVFLEEKKAFKNYRLCFFIHSIRVLFTTFKLIFLAHKLCKNFNGIFFNLVKVIILIFNYNFKEVNKIFNIKNLNLDSDILEDIE